MQPHAPSRPLIRSFWNWSLFPALAALLVLHIGWTSNRRLAVPLPSWPFTANTYVAEYNKVLPHILYRYGFFGIGQRLRQADLLLVGTSHVQFGISATLLSERLSQSQGRPVHVFNMGLGCGEGWGFISKILEHNRIEDKPVLLDLYMARGDTLSGWAAQVEERGRFCGFLDIFAAWSDFLHDWVFDPLLPEFAITSDRTGTRFATWRFMKQFVSRRWDDGDTYLAWDSTDGPLYTATPPYRLTRIEDEIGKFPPYLPEWFTVPPGALQVIARQRLHPLLTLIPFATFDPAAAARTALTQGWPLIPLSPAGLNSWDGGWHLNADSRTAVTELLAPQIGALLPKNPSRPIPAP